MPPKKNNNHNTIEDIFPFVLACLLPGLYFLNNNLYFKQYSLFELIPSWFSSSIFLLILWYTNEWLSEKNVSFYYLITTFLNIGLASVFLVLQAFKNNGVDYILKPFDDNDVFNALEKIKRLEKSLSKSLLNSIKNTHSLFQEKKVFQKSIIAHIGKKMIPIDIENILLFHLKNEAVNIYCSDQKKYVIFKTMNEIESVLDEQRLFRINRQMIINRDAVKEIKQYSKRKIIVQAAASSIEQKIIVSRLKVTPFLNWLEKPI